MSDFGIPIKSFLRPAQSIAAFNGLYLELMVFHRLEVRDETLRDFYKIFRGIKATAANLYCRFIFLFKCIVRVRRVGQLGLNGFRRPLMFQDGSNHVVMRNC